MPKSYQPVSCQLHSELELIIMHKKTIQIQIKTESGMQAKTITPYDIISRSGSGEFLLAYNKEQKKIEFRLDQIISFKAVSV